MRLRCDGIFNEIHLMRCDVMGSFLTAESEGEKKIEKSINICLSYGQLSTGSFLWNMVYMKI